MCGFIFERKTFRTLIGGNAFGLVSDGNAPSDTCSMQKYMRIGVTYDKCKIYMI